MDESCLEYFLKVYRCSLLARHTASLGQYDIVTVPARCPGKSTDSGRLKDILGWPGLQEYIAKVLVQWATRSWMWNEL